MADPALQDLLDTTYTKENFQRKSMLLKEFFSKWFFKEHGDMSLKDNLSSFLDENNIGEALKESLLALSDNFYNHFTKDNMGDVLSDLDSEVEKKPILTMYIPTVLPPVEVLKLGKWVRTNIQKDIFLNLDIDSSSIGGCAFVWNGVYHDFSLKYYFDKNRTEVKNLVRGFENGE